MSVPEFVIVGGGLAAGTAAVTLREEGFDGHLTLIAAEAHKPYIRPPLSKAYLASLDDSELWVQQDAWWHDHDVEVRSGRHVRSLDLADRTISCEGGEPLPFDRLLIATGAAARRLELPGAEADGIHTLRTLEDSRAIRSATESGDKRVVVVGSGWIGMEVAATVRGFGNEVTVVSHSQVPLSAALGDELGEVFEGLHVDHGVHFVRGVDVTGFRVADGRVTGVEYEGGVVDADVVVVGVGASPLTAVAEDAGLGVDHGILVDAGMRTGADGVFAAGDVANPIHPVLGRRLRSEHWANAIGTGRTAALNMLERGVVYDDIPYFYTDQFDLGMEFSGYAPLMEGTHIVYRGDVAGREFVSFWVTGDGRVVAGMNVNVWDVNEQVQGLIRAAKPVDEARLADASIPLGDLVADA
ncbi:NAD(P)/FAD-dependent oxidoreductase [Humibacter ginsenosidimutans]|uniref:NAD(P)/FAD-dependent oxidoreductase n=1 Tax=Humibacter ginsenosidimutans TaxID=2599293 RepID=A0A5B8M3L8_9MICO|nr:FAD-dependent oxidoreductase [Humibacter ginsenosidimutans]QDZ14741.1 NAD(P)/FAD-dependent oxidoreductase [Humibacter ginsenosidimutans]